MTPLPNILQRINWMLGAGIVFRALSAITTLSMTALLVPAIYAEYSFAMSVALLTALIAAAGLPDYIVSRAANGRLHTAQLVWQSWLLNFLLGGLCLLVIGLIIWQEDISIDGKWGIILINMAAVLASSNIISQAALRAIHRISTQAKLMLLSISLSTTTLIFTAWRWGDVRLIGLVTLFDFATMFVIHVTVLNRHQLIQRISISARTLRYLFQQTFPYGVVLILEMAVPVLASYLVLTRFNREMAGSFNLMITLMLSAMMIATALDQAFYPVLVSSRREAAPQIVAGYLIFSIFIVLPAFLIFFFHPTSIANIFLFQKYAQLAGFLALLAYLVPFHFLIKVCTVYFRLQDKQKVPIALYIMVLIWIVARSSRTNVEPVDIGHFIIEGQLFLITLLGLPVLRFALHHNVLKTLLRALLPALVALVVTLPFANNLFALSVALVAYGSVTAVLKLPKDLLELVNQDNFSVG